MFSSDIRMARGQSCRRGWVPPRGDATAGGGSVSCERGTGDRTAAGAACGLGPAIGRWDGGNQKRSDLVGGNVRGLDPRSGRGLAGRLLKIVRGEELVKS